MLITFLGQMSKIFWNKLIPVVVGFFTGGCEYRVFRTSDPPILPRVPTFPNTTILSPSRRLLLTVRSIWPAFCTGVVFSPCGVWLKVLISNMKLRFTALSSGKYALINCSKLINCLQERKVLKICVLVCWKDFRKSIYFQLFNHKDYVRYNFWILF